jgi:hypothetical protein
MARDKLTLGNRIDNSSPGLFPNGRIKDNPGDGTGTPVDERVYGDIHETFAFLLRRFGIPYNNIPDNTSNGYQLAEGISALPTKNDKLLTVGPFNSTTLSVDTKIGSLDTNEVFLCRTTTGFNASLATIRGNDNNTKALTITGEFFANEFVYLINFASDVRLLRVFTANNLDSSVDGLGYLKAATQPQEDAGSLVDVGTTPSSNLSVFTRRVNGVDSGNFLATSLLNGIYPSEHFNIVESLGTNPVRNVGRIVDVDVNSVTGPLVTEGDITAASASSTVNGTLITCTMANIMSSLNYFVRIFIQAPGAANQGNDNDSLVPVFIRQDLTTFLINVDQIGTSAQSLIFHCEVVQY